MSLPPFQQPAKAKSSIFSSRPAIRIPTFQSPTVKPAPAAAIPQTRDEERQARLKGPVGAWNNLNTLLPKGPQPLPSFGKRLGAPPPPKQPAALSPTKRKSPVKARVSQVQQEQPEPAQTTRPTSATSSRRKSKARASTTVQEQQEEEPEVPVASTSSSKTQAGKRKSTSAPTAPRRASTNKAAPAPPAAPAPAAAPKKRKSSVKPPPAPIEEEQPEAELRQQEEQPVASTSRDKGKGKRKSIAAPVEEEEEEPAPAETKKTASKKRSRAEEAPAEPKSKPRSSIKAASAPSKPSSSKNKRVRISDVPPPPVVETFDDAMASTDSELDAEDSYAEPSGIADESEEEDSDEEGAEEKGKRKKGTKIRTERLKGNKGRLNAVDVVYGGVKKLLARKISTLAPTSRPARSLERYSTILQTLLLTRSDQLSTLSTSSAAVSSARAKARQLRTELLGVQKARSGVGKRTREEEEGWKESRKRVETTRDLHSFLNDLSAASLDWQDPPPEVDSAPSPSDNFQPRLERLAAILGPVKTADKPSKKGKGKAGAKEAPGGLLARVQRLNAELRMER